MIAICSQDSGFLCVLRANWQPGGEKCCTVPVIVCYQHTEEIVNHGLERAKRWQRHPQGWPGVKGSAVCQSLRLTNKQEPDMDISKSYQWQMTNDEELGKWTGTFFFFFFFVAAITTNGLVYFLGCTFSGKFQYRLQIDTVKQNNDLWFISGFEYAVFTSPAGVLGRCRNKRCIRTQQVS